MGLNYDIKKIFQSNKTQKNRLKKDGFRYKN